MIDAFRAAGLEVAEPRALAGQEFGFSPLLAGEGIQFQMPTRGAGKAGRVVSFPSEANLKKAQLYYAQQSLPGQFGYTFARANIIVRIDGSLAESAARQYQTVLAALP